MKELIKQNGLLRFGIFSLVTAVPIALILGVILFLIHRFLGGELKLHEVAYVLVLGWIFFGVQSKDFFGPGRQGTLLPKHAVMLSALPLAFFYGSQGDSGLFFGLLFLYLIYFNYSKNTGDKGFYWQHEFRLEMMHLMKFQMLFGKNFFS